MQIEFKLKNISTSMDFSLESFFVSYFNNNINNFSQKIGFDQTFEIKFEISETADAFDNILFELSDIESNLAAMFFFSCPYVEIEMEIKDYPIYFAAPDLNFSNSITTLLDMQKFSKIRSIFHYAKINKEGCIQNIKENLVLLRRTTDTFGKYRFLFMVFEETKFLLESNKSSDYKNIANTLKNFNYGPCTKLEVFYETRKQLININKKDKETGKKGINFSEKLKNAISNKESNEIIWEYIIECMTVIRHKISHGEINKIDREQVNEGYKLLYRVIVQLFLNHS